MNQSHEPDHTAGCSLPAVASGPLPRSYLYVPADRADFLASARRRDADAIIIDLEDAVSYEHKRPAHEAVKAWLGRPSSGSGEIWVRLDSTMLEAQVDLLRAECVTGVVLPKATLRSVAVLDSLLMAVERSANREKPVPVIALIESAAGLASAVPIAAGRRVTRLGVGRADLLAELGVDSQRLPEAQLSAIWLQVVIASAAAGIDPPVAPVLTDIRDLERLETTTREFRDLGFRARTAVHPGQVPTINSTFTPSYAEVEHARRLVDLFDRASGSGVVLDSDGRMVDEAVVRSAREVLRRASTTP